MSKRILIIEDQEDLRTILRDYLRASGYDTVEAADGGLRVRLRTTDPFKNLVGADWTKEHWFATREERDRALKEMSGRYVYFRPGDQPSLEFEKVDK